MPHLSRTQLLDRFLAEHPKYRKTGVNQPGQGATNFVEFLRRNETLVVAKIFGDEERRQRECFALRHWSRSGLVPQIIHAEPHIVVMSHLSGANLHVGSDQTPWRQECRSVGTAVGQLTLVPASDSDRRDFESRFYADAPTLESYLGRIVTLGRGIVARDPDFSGEFWQASLDTIERQLPFILGEPRILYHQDASNLHVLDGRFTGFFDLEMSRFGCVSMQLASILSLLGGNAEAWKLFREGFESATGTSIDDAAIDKTLACHQLLGWREISRYLSYDGTPGSGFDWASPADPAWYRNQFIAMDAMLRR